MKNVKIKLISLIVLAAFATSCKEEKDPQPQLGTLTLDITGLEDLGDDFAYEGWVIVGGTPVSAGVFTVDENGVLSQTEFEVNGLNNATRYVLTIEPSPDNDPAPSSTHILAGDFSDNEASIVVGHLSSLGSDFTSATGGYILATPTDGGSDTDENSGVWWLDPSAGPGASLILPTLPEGWIYEGWVVIDGVAVSTGKFSDPAAADDSALYSSTVASSPSFPGEDLLLNAPSGLTFPTDLSGKTVVISVEPFPDNSLAPFTLKPLVGQVPASAADHTLYNMTNNAAATNPSGTVGR